MISLVLALTTPTWISYGIALGALIAAMGTAWRTVLNPIRKFANRAEAMFPLLIELTETFKDSPHAFAVLDDIISQFKTDSGSSLRDVVNRLEVMGQENAAQIALTKALADTLAIGVESARQLAVRDREELSRLLLQQDRQAAKIDACLLALDKLKDGQGEMRKQASIVAVDLAGSHARADAVRGAPGAAADAGAQSGPVPSEEVER